MQFSAGGERCAVALKSDIVAFHDFIQINDIVHVYQPSSCGKRIFFHAPPGRWSLTVDPAGLMSENETSNRTPMRIETNPTSGEIRITGGN